MALRDFLFGFKFLATDYVSPALKNIETRIEKINEQVKGTARWREAAGNIAVVGGAFLAVGGAAGYALKSVLDTAGAVQTEFTHVATALNDGAASALHLAQAKSFAEKASIASGIGVIQEADAYYIARSNSLDHAKALAAVNVATKLAIGTTASLTEAQTQLEPTTRLLTGIYQTFGNKALDAKQQIAGFGDQLAKLQTQYAFKGIGEVNEALQYAVPLSKAAGVAFSDQNAALALLSIGLKHGAEAGTAYQEVVSKLLSGGKLKAFTALNAQGGIDLGQTIARLKAATAGLSTSQRGNFLHQLGFTERSIQGVAILIDKTGEYKSVVNDLNNSQGANAAAFATREASMELATGRLSAAWDVLKDTIGKALLPATTSLVKRTTELITELHFFAEAHPQAVKYAVTFAAIGAAVLIVGGSLAIASSALLGFVSFLPAVKAVGVAFKLNALAAKAWAAAQFILDAALDANPIALAVIAAAALAVAGYEVYQHWTAVKTFFMSWGKAATWKNLGMNILKGIGDGILAGAIHLLGPLGTVGKLIIDHFPHSPARLGPLRNLHRVRIVEELSRSIQPGPAMAAIRRTAAAVAIAAPLVLSPITSTPAFAGSVSGARGSVSGARGGGITIQVHQEIHIDGAIAGDERKLMATLRAHGEELAQIIDARLKHRERREF